MPKHSRNLPNLHTGLLASISLSSSTTSNAASTHFLLKQTEELALLQPLLVLLQLLEEGVLLGLGLGPGRLLGLGGLGAALGLGGALLGVLEDQLDGRPGAEADGRQDAGEAGPAAGPHLVAKGRGAHGDDVALLDLVVGEEEGRNGCVV